MFLIRVDAAIAAEAEDVDVGVVLLGVGEGGDEGFVSKENAVADAVGDPHRFLIDDAAGTDVLVPDFGVAHDAGGEADSFAGGLDEDVGVFGHEAVVNGVLGEFDGVVGIHFGVGVFAPAVADDEDEGAFGDWGGHERELRSENTARNGHCRGFCGASEVEGEDARLIRR